MSESAPAMLPIFRSAAQLELLTFVFLHSDRAFSLASLSRQLDIPQATVSREVSRLEEAGVLQTSALGRSKLVSANGEAPFFAELRQLLIKVAGPPEFLSRLLSPIAGILEAFIFGSWARRYLGESGPFPRDIDLLVVGQPDIDEVYDAIGSVEELLAIEINPTIVPREEWEKPSLVFLSSIRDQPMLAVVGTE
ncbi:MAG: helix-turn-helix domain-containing protein [Acidimicrobiia bacterium]